MEDETQQQEETVVTKAKRWVEDNLRLIISIIIVVAIAGGIYSYSQRSQEAEVALQDEDTQEQILLEGEDADGEAMEEGGAMEAEGDEAMEEDRDTTMTGTSTPQEPQVTSVDTSRETETSFVESAQPGDGTTHLARRALAHYLEKSPDSELTGAHKIYIEDYLRKHVGHSGRVHPGTEIEFSKSLIQEAIGASKTLSEAQLQNLQKYVVLVPSIS